MDPAPRSFGELPRDAELGLPVPFACGAPDDATTVRRLDGRRVVQCALSRVCGICGAGLGRPIAFVGSAQEADRNAFHFPPTHLGCARALLDAYDGLATSVLGQPEPVSRWVLVTTAAFEFVRPHQADADRRPTFQPNAILSETR